MMEANDLSQDTKTSISRQPHYFYRLNNQDVEQKFKKSENGIECPICCNVQKNIKIHFNKSKQCAVEIDMDHFLNM